MFEGVRSGSIFTYLASQMPGLTNHSWRLIVASRIPRLYIATFYLTFVFIDVVQYTLSVSIPVWLSI